MKRKMMLVAGALALLAAAFATYSVAAGSAAQTINACADDGGKLRLASTAGACKKGETPLSWNTEGPIGPAGPQGAAGPAGPAGASGGAAADPNATSATIEITGQKQGKLGGGPLAVIAVSHEIVSPRDAASGLPTGKRMHKPFVITKELDKSTPLLMQALVTNENLTSVVLSYLRDGKPVATVKLTNASIATYDAHGQHEEIAFTYQKIQWTWLDGGITAQDDWESPVA